MIKFHYFLKKKYNSEIGFVESLELKQAKLSDKKIRRYINKEKTPIDIGFRISGKYFKVRTTEEVYPLHWEQKAQRVKTGHPLSVEINENLSTLKLKVEKGFRLLELNNNDEQPITGDQIKFMIKNIIDLKKPISKSKDFINAFDQFLLVKQPFFKKNTIKKYGTLKGHLLRFQKATSPIRFENINEQFLETFTAYLINTGKHFRAKSAKQSEGWEMKNNSIAKLLSNLKAFLRWSIANDYMTNQKALNYKIKYDATNMVCFSKDEFFKLLEMDLSSNKVMAEVRDTFCFQALTGQRYSDILSLHWGNIVRKNDGLVWACYQNKGNKSAVVEVPISNPAQRILERYPNRIPEGSRDNNGNIIHQRILPVKSEQVINRHLKKLAKMVGLNDVVVHMKFSGTKRLEESKFRWEMISTHTARRTFVTLSLEMGMRPEVVIACTGHTSLKQLYRYTKITEKVKTDELKSAWNF